MEKITIGNVEYEIIQSLPITEKHIELYRLGYRETLALKKLNSSDKSFYTVHTGNNLISIPKKL